MITAAAGGCRKEEPPAPEAGCGSGKMIPETGAETGVRSLPLPQNTGIGDIVLVKDGKTGYNVFPGIFSLIHRR